MRPSGGLVQRFAIRTPDGPLAGWSNFVASRYTLTRDGTQIADMKRVKFLREHYRIEIADGHDRALIHLLLLVMYIIRGGGASSGD